MTKKVQKKSFDDSLHLALSKNNYKLMLIGLVIIITGFILMIGDENIYSFRKITLSVIVVMIGYVFEIYAIMKLPKDKGENPGEEL